MNMTVTQYRPLPTFCLGFYTGCPYTVDTHGILGHRKSSELLLLWLPCRTITDVVSLGTEKEQVTSVAVAMMYHH